VSGDLPFVDLPVIDALVEVKLADGRAHPVRVVEADGLQLTVVGTQVSAGVAPPRPGDMVSLRWAGRRGRCAAPCLVRSVHSVQFATWTLDAGGTVEVEQRRRFARAAAHGPIHLGPDEPEIGLVVLGQLVDVGEGGIRCRLAAGGLDAGQPVFVRMVLDDRMVTLTGTVLRQTGAELDGTVEAIVVFDADNAQARAIRRYVLNRQRLDRAVRTDAAL
jgi:hypothetical protein